MVLVGLHNQSIKVVDDVSERGYMMLKRTQSGGDILPTIDLI